MWENFKVLDYKVLSMSEMEHMEGTKNGSDGCSVVLWSAIVLFLARIKKHTFASLAWEPIVLQAPRYSELWNCWWLAQNKSSKMKTIDFNSQEWLLSSKPSKVLLSANATQTKTALKSKTLLSFYLIIRLSLFSTKWVAIKVLDLFTGNPKSMQF